MLLELGLLGISNSDCPENHRQSPNAGDDWIGGTMYAFEMLKREEFESLFEMKRETKKLTPISNHWLTSGEIWQLIGMDKYGLAKSGIPVVSSMSVRSPQYAVPTAGSISVSLA